MATKKGDSELIQSIGKAINALPYETRKLIALYELTIRIQERRRYSDMMQADFRTRMAESAGSIGYAYEQLRKFAKDVPDVMGMAVPKSDHA